MKKHSQKFKYEIIYSKDLQLEKFYENNRIWAVRIKNALNDDRIVPFIMLFIIQKQKK